LTSEPNTNRSKSSAIRPSSSLPRSLFARIFRGQNSVVDSAWDAVHTVIRPIGGALLAIQVLGHPSRLSRSSSPSWPGHDFADAHGQIDHTSGSHASPEPFSNIRAQRRRDAAVLGGLALIHFQSAARPPHFYPGHAHCSLFRDPNVARDEGQDLARAHEVEHAGGGRRAAKLPATLSARLDSVFDRENVLDETITWAVPCVSGRGRRIPANLFGALVATNEEPRKITFVARKNGRPFAQRIELDGGMIAHNRSFFPKT